MRQLLAFVDEGRKLMFLKFSCQKPMKKKLLETARNFSKVSLHFNKIPNTLRQILQVHSEICIFCVLQKSPPEAVGKN